MAGFELGGAEAKGPVEQAVLAAIGGCMHSKLGVSILCKVVAAAARGATQGLQAAAAEDSSSKERGSTVDKLQWLLVVAGEVLGQGVTITSLKARLRSVGAHEVASRVGKATKLRNGLAHPDVALQQDVLAALVRPRKEDLVEEPRTQPCPRPSEASPPSTPSPSKQREPVLPPVPPMPLGPQRVQGGEKEAATRELDAGGHGDAGDLAAHAWQWGPAEALAAARRGPAAGGPARALAAARRGPAAFFIMGLLTLYLACIVGLYPVEYAIGTGPGAGVVGGLHLRRAPAPSTTEAYTGQEDDNISNDMALTSAQEDVATDVTVPMDDEEAFDVLDGNGDGAITMRELSMWSSSQANGPFKMEDIKFFQNGMPYFDKDGDVQLNFEEFIELLNGGNGI